MVTVLKNDIDGYVYAYCEWYIVNRLGQFENNGRYLWIHDLWIHPKHRYTSLRELISEINANKFSHSAKIVYWTRGKYSYKQSIYLKSKLLKRGYIYEL